MCASYFLVLYLIPTFVFKKKYLLSFLLFITSAYIFSVVSRLIIVHIIEPLVRDGAFEQESFIEILIDWKILLLSYFPSVYIVVIIFIATHYFVKFTQLQQQNATREQEKTAHELKMLKAQLNPHFLFNTLNNIYVLSLDNSPIASESICKLSEILDYVLYRCNQKFVSLFAEIQFLENFIALEKLRYDERLTVTLKNSITEDISIAPLILLSLVENAFKHGAGEDSGTPFINIHLKKTNSLFIFEIENSISSFSNAANKGNIGLTNIKKQLDLIYKNSYNLGIMQLEDQFKVRLEITL
ncbi:MAG: histidine kinase [Flavobacteriaceae bacterium]|nr:MAG: histidine kinase [Flavobacteriaceae bacterium]